MDLPPSYYDHAYDGPIIERVITAADVALMCGHLDRQACILFKPNFLGDRCFIILPIVGIGGTNQYTQDILRRHEIGHCNGWSENHAEAR